MNLVRWMGSRTVIAAGLSCISPFSISGQTFVLLWPNGAPGSTGIASDTAQNPYITPFPASNPNGAGAVILPGGGYDHLATVKEGNAVAQWLNGIGVTAFVVKYRLGTTTGGGYHHPNEMWDAQRALRWVRANAGRYGVDIRRVGLVGFSAGGHLASTVATHYDAGSPSGIDIDNYTGTHDSVDVFSCRPDFQILGYPVITMNSTFTHLGSRTALLGNTPSAALITLLSNELQVSPATPPAFIVATLDDAAVPVRNSQAYADSLRSKGVPYRLLLYPSGTHGFGLANGQNGAPNYADVGQWPDSAAAWMRRMGYLTPATPVSSRRRLPKALGNTERRDAQGRNVSPRFLLPRFWLPGPNP